VPYRLVIFLVYYFIISYIYSHSNFEVGFCIDWKTITLSFNCFKKNLLFLTAENNRITNRHHHYHQSFMHCGRWMCRRNALMQTNSNYCSCSYMLVMPYIIGRYILHSNQFPGRGNNSNKNHQSINVDVGKFLIYLYIIPFPFNECMLMGKYHFPHEMGHKEKPALPDSQNLS
jgi:hypothetical protein